MKTLIEFYVNEQYDNLLAAYVFRPERVVFVCTDSSPDKLTRQSILAFLNGLGSKTSAEFVYFGNKTVDELFERVGEVCSKYEDCAVEMSGGSPAVLIAAHSYCTKYKINAFYFDYSRNRFVSIRGMRRTIDNTPMPVIDVKTLLKIGGACVTGTCHSTKQLRDNVECIRKVLLVYSRNFSDWNVNSEYLQYCCKHFYDASTQIFSAKTAVRTNNTVFLINKRIMKELEEAGAVTELSFDDESVFFRFRSGFIKDVLSTVGMCLELMIYISALDSGSFADTSMSVVFDWDGIIHANKQDTVNEIDVVMIRGLSPIFVSCKSAKPDTRDLYEIWYLAHRFGGRRAKAVIVTAVSLSSDAWATYTRARDMGVIVIEKADILQYSEKDWIHDRLLCPKWLDSKP